MKGLKKLKEKDILKAHSIPEGVPVVVSKIIGQEQVLKNCLEKICFWFLKTL